MEGDSSAEIRSMMMVMHPCPPLPICGGEIDGEIDGEPQQTSSHDALSFCVDLSARRNDVAWNNERAVIHQAWIDMYMRRLMEHHTAGLAFPGHEEVTYAIMSDFTRIYIQSYFPRSNMDIRFAPLDSATNPMRALVCQWLAARQIVDEERADAREEDHAHKSTSQLYAECALIIIKSWRLK